MESDILCFKHCGTKIFCFDIPEICPACVQTISTDNLEDVPFRIPHPFIKAVQYPCAIVMKSTQGNLLEDYHNSKDLHIGVTNSKGSVFEFDSEGLVNHKTKEWNQSILIYKATEVWYDHWDLVLEEVRGEIRWRAEEYDEVNNNCYTFVLEFLKKLESDELKGYIGNKEDFSKQFVVPKTNVVRSYITMYRNVKKMDISLITC
ncbi:hypothetical protein HHI36_006085, partial [Cryptolaemus montrouzieri]